MHIVINIIVTLALLYWPVVMMMSPMMFAAPGADDNKGAIFTAFFFMSYPVTIFLLLGVLGGKYFGFNSFVLALISAIVVFFVLSFFGYTGMMSNVIRGIPNSGYGVVGNTVYYNADPIVGADAESFNAYKSEDYHNDYSVDQYAADNQYLYFRGKPLPGIRLENLIGKIVAYDFYWLNDTQVIRNGEVIAGLDPQTFGDFEGYSYWTYSKVGEKYTLYYDNTSVDLADFHSFIPLTDRLAKDKNRIFYDGQPITLQVDIDSFEAFSTYGFARDKGHLYYLGSDTPILINGADPDSFDELGWGYYRDKNAIYYVEEENVLVLDSVDYRSFEIVGYIEDHEYDAKDANAYYMRGQKVSEP
jgi:hypothetical protein